MHHQIAETLANALPQIQKLKGMTIVVKYGGHAMVDEQLKIDFARDISLLNTLGLNPVVVHGGGPQITHVLEKMGIEPLFIRGMRITDQATMDVVEMVLAGKVNKSIVHQINRQGGAAVGLNGKDGQLITAHKMRIVHHEKGQPPETIDPGFVGDVTEINPRVLHILSDNGFIPVVAPVGVDEKGITYNINADLVASHVAAAVRAERLFLITDVDGVMDGDGNLISTIDKQTMDELIHAAVISEGMIPKVEFAMKAVQRGVVKASIINGKKAHAILCALLDNQPVGTQFIR